jgi:transposase
MAIDRSLSMAGYKPELTDEQWSKIEKLLPKRKPNPKGGRTPAADRDCFEGILWVLRSGARWKDLPKVYPSSSTCWRRLRDWEEQDIWLDLWRVFLSKLDEAGQLDWHEVFADGTFSSAKKGAPASDLPNAARVQSLWWWQTARVCLSESNLPRRRPTK